ncbi:MAG: hypothetical protein CMP61_05190 [Flavobacteriales bacterium]|nr:hypothetical protein [Flavobacteriales bacterium]|tara:strand:+ start:3441 stop:3794 length:354 start_codon:yes stop_codon:yes gene_type:complete
MNLIEIEKKKRIKGVVIGAVAPVVALFVLSVMAYFKIIFDRPYLTDEVTKLTVGASSLFGVFWVYATSASFFQAFFSLSVNMLLVFFFSNRQENSLANGIIVPTAIYALILVGLRLL